MKAPKPEKLRESLEWVKWKFGIKGQARGALSHVNRCLDEIASREYDFLMSKANLLGYLERWDELKELLKYLNRLYPNDPELLCHHAEFQKAQGNWKEALRFLTKAEKKMKREHSRLRECLFLDRIDCLVALEKDAEAICEAKQVVKKYKNYSIVRSALRNLERGKYVKPEAWALEKVECALKLGDREKP